MRLWAVLVVPALLSGAACARADTIMIEAEHGAHCTLQRDGKLLVATVIATGDSGGTGLSEQVVVDSAVSHSDIQVTCSLGNDAVTATARFLRVETINDVPLCVGAPSDCPKAWTSHDWRYPQIFRVPLASARSVIPQAVSFSLTGAGGPYWVTADAYRVAEAVPPPGSTATRADTLPFTAWQRSTNEQQRRIGELSFALLKQGTAQTPSCAAAASGPTGKLDIFDGGADIPFEFPMACVNRTASALVDTLRCAARPERPDCKKEN